MSPLRWNYLSVITLLLIPTRRADITTYKRQRIDASPFPPATASMFPYWEYLLREFVFKTISPPPPANNALYKRLLEAPFFGGPFPSFENNDNALLSKGDVYHLPDGHWLLCQEGCVDCDVCSQQKEPTVKWTLRRIRQQTSLTEPRYDLQLTIVPQVDGSFHMENLSPRSYIYVTSQTDRPDNLPIKLPWSDGGYLTSMVEQNTEEEQTSALLGTPDSLDHWNHEENNETSGSPPTSQLLDTKDLSSDPVIWKSEDTVNVTNELTSSTPSSLRSVEPRLILGMDQFGQKHLIHIVPASDADSKMRNETVDPSLTTNARTYSMSSSSSTLMPVSAGPDKSSEDSKAQLSIYEKVFHRVLDSLNTHKQVIERFLSAENEDYSGTGATDESLENDQLRSLNDSTNYESYNEQDLDNVEEYQQSEATQKLQFIRKPIVEMKWRQRRLCPVKMEGKVFYSGPGRSRRTGSLSFNSTNGFDGEERGFIARTKADRDIRESGRSSIDGVSMDRYEIVGKRAKEFKDRFEKVSSNFDEREPRRISQSIRSRKSLASMESATSTIDRSRIIEGLDSDRSNNLRQQDEEEEEEEESE